MEADGGKGLCSRRGGQFTDGPVVGGDNQSVGPGILRNEALDHDIRRLSG